MFQQPIDRRRLLGLLLGAGVAGGVDGFAAQAEAAAVPSDDRTRIEELRTAVLSGQLTDGAIPTVRYANPGRPALVDAYFANLACLGLLSAHAYRRHAATEEFVVAWLEWYADHQAVDGTISRFNGLVGADEGLAPNPVLETSDSQDSYAATYLSVVAQLNLVTGWRPTAKVITACLRCLDVLERCRGGNGLYWNFAAASVPDGTTRAQYLLDNVEVHQGLVNAKRIFTAARQPAVAKEVQGLARDLASKMHLFWYPAQSYFVTLYQDRVEEKPWGGQLPRPEALATVSALAFFNHVSRGTRTKLWTKLITRHGELLEAGFQTEAFVDEDPSIERVYLAALKAAPRTAQSTYLAQLRTRADTLITRNEKLADDANAGLAYPAVHRYGMLIQGLLAQTGRVSAQLPLVPLNAAKAP